MQLRKEAQPRLIQAMIDMFSLPDLRHKLLFTMGILVVFRFMVHIPSPIVTPEVLQKLAEAFEQNQLLGMLNLFSGGAMKTFSVAALGVYPYITASIIMQLLVPVIPRLQAIAQEGEAGQHKINRITNLATVPLAAMQGYAQITLLRSQHIIEQPEPSIVAVTIISIVAGT
ncbi:MAG: preprotein translocase subunit SecY, partial [Chloroflexota bacterium]|nr:preprotein translocase subunit SecY [Chloroflexota bacterium]